jgi:hypothetical protein
MKKLIAACIDRIIDFDSPEEAATYISGLRDKKVEFRIVYREAVDEKYRVRVQEQYNKTPMIEG